jgi:hypothetical protein
VKAPSSCPNNSEAINSRGIAAQFTLTNAREVRSDRRCMARATSSLPVPVSPVIGTVESVAATFTTRESAACNAGDVPHNLFKHGDPLHFMARASHFILVPSHSTICHDHRRANLRDRLANLPCRETALTADWQERQKLIVHYRRKTTESPIFSFAFSYLRSAPFGLSRAFNVARVDKSS